MIYQPVPAPGINLPMCIEKANPVADLDVADAAGDQEYQLLHLLQHHLPVRIPAIFIKV